MRSFRDCLPRDGAAKIISLISHITLLNEEKEPNALSLIKDAAFAIPRTDNDLAIKFRSKRTVEHFNCFFEHLQGMNREYILNGKEAEDFVRRGLMRI